MGKYTYTLAAVLTASLLAYANTPKDAAQLYEAANMEFEAGRFEQSLGLYLKADSAYWAEGLEGTAEYAQALHSTGRAYLNTDNAQLGRVYTGQALALREKLYGKVSEKYIVSLNNYALSYLQAEEIDSALKYQREVISLCRQMDPPNPDEGMYLINLGRVHYFRQDTDSAVMYIEAALPKVEKFGPNYEYALNFLGSMYMERNDNANVLRIFGLMEEHNRHELAKECVTPECHLERAEYYMATGQPANAKEEYMAVFDMPLTQGQKADACRRYAEFLYSEHDHVQAGEYYAMASDASLASDGESEYATTLLRLAGVCYFLGSEYDKAIEAHSRVISDVDRCGYSEGLKGESLLGLGNAYSAKMDFATSTQVFRQLVGHLKANGHENEADYAKAYERLAASEKFNKDYDASIADYTTAISLYEGLGMHDEAEQADNGLRMCMMSAGRATGESSGKDAAAQQRTDKLNEIIQSGLNTLEQSGDYLGNLFKAQTLAMVAGCYADLGDYDSAIEYYAQYINAIRPALIEDFLLKNPKEREITWRHELLNLTQMNTLIMDLSGVSPEQYSRLSGLIYDGQLLSKGILLSSSIEFSKILDRYGTPEMKSQYQRIKDNLTEIERMRQEHRPLEEIQSKIRETDALQLSLSRESAEIGRYTDFLKYTRADVAAALAADEAAVEFVTLGSEIFPEDNMIVAVIVSNEFPTGIAVPVCIVSNLKRIIKDKSKFGRSDYAAQVWGGVMQFVQGKKKIYFAPDGVLNNIGIEYLTMDGTPINDKIEMSRLSSTREICIDHPAQPLGYASVFGNIDYLGDPAEASDKRKYRKTRESDGLSFSTLENTEREVSEISDILKNNVNKSKVFLYTGEKASKAEFISQDELPLNLLHIATHGKYIDEESATDDDAMSRSILAFAGANLYDSISVNEGIVTAAQIAEMSLPDCGLVVLSACESGLGKLGDDGVFGLQRGFKNAGVKSLLVSLNEVADEATADMMIAFYRNLVIEGTSVREALRRAQTEIRTRYPGDDTWASFILIDSFN